MKVSKPLAYLSCLIEACRLEEIPYEIVDQHGNLIKLNINQQSYYFANSSTPWNNNSLATICIDKEFSYRILHKSILMPKTIGFVNPHLASRFAIYREEMHVDEIITKVVAQFAWPVIIKMNRGSRKRNVFLCENEGMIKQALSKIYDRQSINHDYLALAQEYIKPKKEYRAIYFMGELVLLYEKNKLLWQQITDPIFCQQMTYFIKPLFNILPVEFVGLDVIEDEKGQLYLLELNSAPSFSRYLADNPPEPIIELYQKMINYLKNSA